MTPSARIEATIEILGALESTTQPADRFIRDWFRARRYAGAKDRASVAERVFGIFRKRAAFAFRMRAETPRALAIASLLDDGLDADAVATLFSGGTYAPAPLSLSERDAILHPPPGPAPLDVQGNFPAFLEQELTRAFGANLRSEVASLNGRASVDLRVNALTTDRSQVLAQLKDEGIEAHPTPYAPFGVRLASGDGSSSWRAPSNSRMKRHNWSLILSVRNPARRSSISRPAPVASRSPSQPT
jgi:16S rRNA (cytosine967-C5)-methyltransferase